MASGRVPGITMLLRLKNEEEWIEPCLRSVSWADQIILCFQNSSDRTEEIARDVISPKKSSVYHYPYDSRPNGPGHDTQPYDVYNRAYFYNWCFAKTSTKYIVKWDGDMVALDSLENILRAAENQYDFVSFFGENIVCRNNEWRVNTQDRYCGCEPRFMRSGPTAPWKTGKLCESYAYDTTRNALRVPTSPISTLQIREIYREYNERMAKKLEDG